MIRANIVLVPIVLLTFALSIVEAKREIPGAIELIGYNSRKARMNADSFDESKHVTLPMEKEKADIETVKHNIEAYNKLMKVDTKKLTNQQKDMLERIVERVARLKAVLDVNKNNNHTKDSTDDKTSTVDMDNATTPMITEVDSSTTTTTTTPTSTTEELITTTTLLPESTTTVKVTDINEARANNLNSNLSKNRVDGLTKVRQTTTPKYSSNSSSGKTTTKRNNLHRVSQKHTSTTPAGSSNIKSASTLSTRPVHSSSISSSSSIVTATPMQQLKQHAKPHNTQSTVGVVQETSTIKLQLPQSSDNAEESTNAANGGGSLTSDLIYGSNETASSIIDTLANHAREDYYTKGPLIESTNTNSNNNKGKKPSATAKPTKYHYYPHNQHIYLLPECAIQQVCNAVYVRLNYTQPLCACPSRYRDPCSASLNEDDQHTTKLIGNSKKKAITLAKTCEATTEMRECRSPKDWSLLALQNTRTGKSHYLVICRCPDHFKLEGPMAHDQPTYASVPGIRVFGMMCVRPGFQVRKPSVQPPKRYQLQKPFYMPTSNQQYSSNKDKRPTYHDDSYQMQHQANYQYLNRPESSSIINISNAQDFVDSISLNNFDGIYGRNNERKGETTASTASSSSTSSDTKTKREKRSTINVDDPPFPWERLAEFQNSVVWD